MRKSCDSLGAFGILVLFLVLLHQWLVVEVNFYVDASVFVEGLLLQDIESMSFLMFT